MRKILKFVIILLILLIVISSCKIRKEDIMNIKEKGFLDDDRHLRKLSFPSSEIKIKSGESKIVKYGVANLDDENLKFKTEFFYFLDNNLNKSMAIEGETEFAKIEWDSDINELKPNEYITLPIKMTAKNISEIFIIKILILDITTNEEYMSKGFFLNIIK